MDKLLVRISAVERGGSHKKADFFFTPHSQYGRFYSAFRFGRRRFLGEDIRSRVDFAYLPNLIPKKGVFFASSVPGAKLRCPSDTLVRERTDSVSKRVLSFLEIADFGRRGASELFQRIRVENVFPGADFVPSSNLARTRLTPTLLLSRAGAKGLGKILSKIISQAPPHRPF